MTPGDQMNLDRSDMHSQESTNQWERWPTETPMEKHENESTETLIVRDLFT